MSTITYSKQLMQLLQVLWDKPEDQIHRRVVADCAEEEGLVKLAECLRWMAKNDKYPDTDNSKPRDSIPHTWWWVYSEGRPQHAILPVELDRSARTYYSSIRQAEEDLYQTWADNS